MPEKMIAYCGLDCAVCPAFHAAERQTLEQRQETANKWNMKYHVSVKAEDIDCVGCTVKSGQHIWNCTDCAIRVCGLKKSTAVTTCAACPDYGCATLENFIKSIPQAKANLEALRAK